jgi:steroid delta-isomerase-like uncharacterized protein
MSDTRKDVARRILEEAFGQGRLELVDELVTAETIGHDPALPDDIVGPDALKMVIAGYRAAFPDLTMTVEDQIAEGDEVVTRWTARGTHAGELWGIAGTGKQATVTGIGIDRFDGDKVAESWTNWDALGLLQQLGVVAAPAAV